jgi:hypothetical protein
MSVAIMFDPKTQKVINEAQKKVMGATCENVCADGMIQGYIELYSTGLYKSVKDMVYKTATPIIGNDAGGEPIYQPKESVYKQLDKVIGIDELAKKAEEFKKGKHAKIANEDFDIFFIKN